MTHSERLQAILDMLMDKIPSALADAGLERIESFTQDGPKNVEEREICVYIDFEKDDTMTDMVGYIIQVQLPGIVSANCYHSIIYPILKDFFTAELIGFTDRESIEADLWHSGLNGSSSFCFYTGSFSQDLDDCSN